MCVCVPVSSIVFDFSFLDFILFHFFLAAALIKCFLSVFANNKKIKFDKFFNEEQIANCNLF